MKTDRMIGRCPVKGCATTATVEVPLERFTRRNRFGSFDVLAPAVIVNHRAVEVDDLGRWGGLAVCVEHHRSLMFRSVQGTTNPAVKCDAKCRNAKRASCECSCGGAHHGETYAG